MSLKDEFRKQGFLDVVEFDDTVNLKGDLSMGGNVNAKSAYGYAVNVDKIHSLKLNLIKLIASKTQGCSSFN